MAPLTASLSSDGQSLTLVIPFDVEGYVSSTGKNINHVTNARTLATLEGIEAPCTITVQAYSGNIHGAPPSTPGNRVNPIAWSNGGQAATHGQPEPESGVNLDALAPDVRAAVLAMLNPAAKSKGRKKTTK